MKDYDFIIEDNVLTKYNGNSKAICIPEGVTCIGHRAFEECAEIESVIFPSTLTKISSFAFSGCINLSNVVMQDGVRDIDYRAFACCKKLSKIMLPATIENITIGAFSECNNMEISVTDNNKKFKSDGNCLISKETNTLLFGTSKSQIPDYVKKIGSYAFDGCEKAMSVIIPEGVEEICAKAFINCTGIVSINIPSTVTEIGFSAFLDCSAKLEYIKVAKDNSTN